MINFGLNKRQKIILTAIILCAYLLSTGFLPLSFYLTYKLHLIIGFAAFSYLLSVWSLWEGLNRSKALILMILPTLFTLAVISYYFLLPVRWLTRLPVTVVFGLIWYTLLLSQNVFNVSATRTIPLYRVASTVVFVLTILTASLLFNVIFALHLLFLLNILLVTILSFLLILQVHWSIQMNEIDMNLIIPSLILGLIVGEVGMALSFWPLTNTFVSVFLTGVLYLVLGITTDHLRGRLTQEGVYSYIRWGVPVFLFIYLATSWTG